MCVFLTDKLGILFAKTAIKICPVHMATLHVYFNAQKEPTKKEKM